MSNEEEMMIEVYWLNIGSLILGLIAWGMPIIDMMQYKNRNFKRTGIFSIVSLSACAASLCMQIFYTDHLVKIEDWTVLMDTSYAVARVSLILLMITIILNAISLVLCYRGEFCEKENSY